MSTRPRLLSLAGVALLVAAWSLASLAGGWFVPAPWITLVDAAALLGRIDSWAQIGVTLLRVLVGFGAGFASGVAVGMAMGARREARALLGPLVLFFQGLPPLLWAIPIVVITGAGHLPAIVVIALVTFPVVAVTICEGMASRPLELREMLRLFAPGWRARVRELVLPHLRPFLGAAATVGIVLAAKASVIAEYFGATDGIGFQIQIAYQSLQIRRLFAWALILIFVVLLLSHLAPRAQALGPKLRRLVPSPRPSGRTGEEAHQLRAVFLARTSTPVIRLNGVSFHYRKKAAVFEGINLKVQSHEIAVISGDSGIGKTTLLKVVAGLLRPQRGIVACPSRIGFVFQDDRLLPWRDAVSNVSLPLRYSGYDPHGASGFASYLLGEAGLPGEEHKRPDELSGGMKKRVALARCFARIPEAIILDEPFSDLHREARVQLWEALCRLLALHPVPVILVTHFPEEVAQHAACRQYVLSGSPATLLI